MPIERIVRPKKFGMQTELRLLIWLATLPLIGMAGFMLIEGWNAFDSLYMATITLTTVGYGEIHPLSNAGRAFVMGYLIFGLGVFFFGMVRLGELVVRTEIGNWMEKRRMSEQVRSLTGHFIVCGSGRMGRTICKELAAKRLPFVVIEKSEAAAQFCREMSWPFVLGDATDDRILEEVGITRARGLAAALSNDSDNLYVVMSARLLAPKLQIVSRVDDEQSAVKMRKAGANRVIGLYSTSAMKVAQLLTNPELEDFLEVLTTKGEPLELVEIHIAADSLYAGKTILQTDFLARGVIVVAVRHASGAISLPPPDKLTLKPDDVVIALGLGGALSRILDRGGETPPQ